MNVLLYVMTILMILSVLTYAKLESFRMFAGLEASFKHYMTSTERLPLDRMNTKMYDSVKILSKGVTSKELPNAASSRLSFYSFLKKDGRDLNPDVYPQTRELAKILMTNLYGEQRFFQEIALKRPNFLNEILDEIQVAAENQEPLKMKNAMVLSKLKFQDPELQYIFYLMLHGLPNLTVQKNVSDSPEIGFGGIIPVDDNSTDADEEAMAKVESEEAKAPPGYDSLIDYITVKPAQKIRVFLAPRELLVSIYGNPDIADSIIETRTELANKVKSKALTINDATEQFRNAFSQSGNSHNFSAILDFAVTNTNPSKYNK